MSRINVYLSFSGECREAMEFYKDCLGGQLECQTIGDSPMGPNMPPDKKNHVMHSSLTKGDLVVMATDMGPEGGLVKGNSISLLLDCGSEDEIRTVYAKLSVGGTPVHPVSDTFWGALFGDLVDRFGNRWMLNYTKPAK